LGDRSSPPRLSSRDKERRKHLRREPRELVYIDLGPDNCGFILDVSEGGISFKGISSLRDGETLKVRFRLPGTDLSIQAEGQFVRAGSTANSSVLRFRDVPYDVRMRIREWVVLAELEESMSSEQSAPTADLAISSFQPAKKNRFDPVPPAGHDGISPMSSIFAQRIPTNGDEAILPSASHPDAPIRASSNMPKTADPAPNFTREKLPLAGNHPAGAVGRDRWSDDDIKNAEWPKEPFELTIRPAPKASPKVSPAPKQVVVNEAVPAAVAKQPSMGKSFPMSQFTAGIVVGCVVLASAGGALVATGRLRLVKSSAPSGIAASSNLAPSISEGSANVGSQNPPAQHPVITPNALITAQPDSLMPPLSAAPKLPSATAPVRNESLRKNPARKDNVEKQPATSSSKSTNPKAQEPGQAATVEMPQISEPVRKAEPASSMQLNMSRPVGQARSAPARSDAQAPSIPAAAAQSLPEVGAATPAAVSQVASASGATEAFASPQIEDKPTRAKSTAKVSQSSSPVFAAPDPSGAKPSSIVPAERVLYVEPVYPAAARAAKVQGSVDVLATIGKDGVPRSLEALDGDPRLAAAAIDAVANWRYRPATLNGQSEESLITITVKFTL